MDKKQSGSNHNFFDRLDKAKKIHDRYKDVLVESRKEDAERLHQIRLQDLHLQMHQVDDVSLPFPNLFAMSWLNKRLNGIDNLNLQNLDQVAAVIWILENQVKPEEITVMTETEIRQAINTRASEIPVTMHMKFLVCIQEVFEYIKKNYSMQTERLLEETLAMLRSDFSSPGASA